MPFIRYLFQEHKIKSSGVTAIIILVLGYGMYTGSLDDWILQDANTAKLDAEIIRLKAELVLSDATVAEMTEQADAADGLRLLQERNVGALLRERDSLVAAAEQRERLITYLSGGCNNPGKLFELLEITP